MTVHLEPVQYLVRVYDPPDSFKERSPYRAIVTVQIMEDIAFIQGAHGEITRMDWIDILASLEKKGIKFFFAKRNGKSKEYDLSMYLKKLKKAS